MPMHKTAVYAIGGNALQNPMSDNSAESAEVLAKVMSDVVDLLESGWGVILTHGNGPQVGHLMQLDNDLSHAMDEWVSATQGMIGHSLATKFRFYITKTKATRKNCYDHY